MGFLSSRFSDSQGLRDEKGWLIRAIGGATTHAGVQVSEHAAVHLPVVYACINRIANPLATFPLNIYQRKGGSSELVTEHPMSQRLGLRPNDYMSGRTVRKTNTGHALLWGNGYREIERNRKGEAIALWPLLPDRTAPKRLDGSVVFRTTVDGRQFDIDHGDVLHLMDQSQDGYVGRSQVSIAAEAIGWGLALEQFGSKFFANDAKSGGFLMHPGRLSSNAQGRLGGASPAPSAEDPRRTLERQGGLDNAHRVKVLEEGMKFIQTTVPPEDAQFLGSRSFATAEIARIYDVPLILLQAHDGTTTWGSGIEQLMIGFVQQTIGPWAHADEQEMNWKLFTEAERDAGLYVKYNMNALLRGDMAARSAFYKSLFEVSGASPNQILAWEDQPGLGPIGDHTFVPVNFQTLDQAVAGPGNATPPPADGAAP